MLTVGSLFAGIGGFDLGFERAGMRTLWQVEQSEFCRRVLAKHFPEAHRFNDVRDVTGDPQRWADHGGTLLEYVDVLCGGFPCQDISLAGLGAGLEGERSGLWSEFARLIRELRPRYVVVENVSALLARGLGTVLGDLAACGYDAEWDCLPASAFGAPHRRDRFWLIAYPAGEQHEGRTSAIRRPATTQLHPDADQERRDGRAGERGTRWRAESADVGEDSDSGALQPWRVGGRIAQAGGPEWWAVEPPVGRVAHGVPDRLDQLAALGNALVPQIAEWIGRRIIEWEEGEVAA